MAGKSSIEWTEHTWNPIVGCSIVSPGCTNCYAMRMAARLQEMNRPGKGGPRHTVHYDGTTKKVNGNAVWTGKIALAPERILFEPLKRKRPTIYFVNSMGDLFHESIPDGWIDRVFAVMALCPQHTFQVLTKRAVRMRDYCLGKNTRQRIDIERAVTSGGAEDNWPCTAKWPVSNVWLGVSCERQQEADERIPHLLQTPAAVRFISAEPLLGPIDLHAIRYRDGDADVRYGVLNGEAWVENSDSPSAYDDDLPRLDWVIVGGESGPQARPMHPGWARAIRDDCASSGIAFFFKQWGEWTPRDKINVSKAHALCGLMGSEPHVERDWYKACEFLQKGRASGACVLERVGKAEAGRLLDGRTHDEFPKIKSARVTEGSVSQGGSLAHDPNKTRGVNA